MARQKRQSDLKATDKRIDAEIAFLIAARDNGENLDHEQYINALVDGDTIAPPKTYTAQLEELKRQKWNINEALDVLAGKERLAQTEIHRRYCADLKKESDLQTKQLVDSVVLTHKLFVDYFKTKRHLIGNSIGLHGGVFSLDLEQFFGVPTDRTGALANFFREAVKNGHLKNMPEALK
jgi:hypothetical protein